MDTVAIHVNVAPNIKEIVEAFPNSIRGRILKHSMADALRPIRNKTRKLIRKEALGSGLNNEGKPRPKGAEHLWKAVIVISRKSKYGGFAAVGYESFNGGRSKAPHAHLLELGVGEHTTPTGQYPPDKTAGKVAAAIKAKGGPDLFAPIWSRFNIQGRRQLDHPGFKGYHFLPRAFASEHMIVLRRFNDRMRKEIAKALQRIVVKGLNKEYPALKFSNKGTAYQTISGLSATTP